LILWRKTWGLKTFRAYIIKTKFRDPLQKYLKKNGIDTAIHYPMPIHRQSAFKNQFGEIKLPKTDYFRKRILSLPINPHLKKTEVDFVIKKIKEFYNKL
jgi:dTDP-4-amino-4,6-dideoxygalactose transaminase